MAIPKIEEQIGIGAFNGDRIREVRHGATSRRTRRPAQLYDAQVVQHRAIDTGAILDGHVPGSGSPTYILIYKDGVCARSLTFPFDGHKPFVQTGCP